MNRKKVSKEMAYLLRHNPKGLDVSDECFVDFGDLVDRLKERWPDIDKTTVRKIVEKDPKGRYEIRDGKIRAKYGHSIDVSPTLPKVTVKKLYHGTKESAVEKILEEGLKSKGRKKVHLSKNIEDAVDVGKRRTSDPIVLEIDVMAAKEEGVEFERASGGVFVTDHVPSKFVSIKERSS